MEETQKTRVACTGVTVPAIGAAIGAKAKQGEAENQGEGPTDREGETEEVWNKGREEKLSPSAVERDP